MAIPQLSAEDRAQALEKAKAARIKRAQVREDLKNEKVTLADVIAMKDDPVVGRMKVPSFFHLSSPLQPAVIRRANGRCHPK